MQIFEILICSTIVVTAYIISYFQFKEKGILLNNAYLYASKEERQKMDKGPHYRQSGIVFFLIGTLFLLLAIQMVTEMKWLFYLTIGVGIIMAIYAIVSSIQIEKKR